MRIYRILTQETEPQRSAYDPYGFTVFGSISFMAGRHKVTIHTINQCADYFEVSRFKLYEFSLDGENRAAVNDFIERIWSLKETIIELPEVIGHLVA